MKDSPLISVIIPVYNVEKYLRKCVESVIAQTYTNLEIMLVDDGSPDRCPEICDELAQQDCRIRVMHKENGGLASARNAALDNVNGDLISFVDSDDWCEPRMFECMLDAFIRTNTSIVLCGVFLEWNFGRKTKIWNFSEELKTVPRELALRWFFNGKITSWACNKLYDRALWRTQRFENQLYEDIPIFRTFLMQVDSIAIVAEPLYHYLQRDDSIVHEKFNEKQLVYLDEYEKNVEYSLNHGRAYDQETRSTLVFACYLLLKRIYFSEAATEMKDVVRKLICHIKENKSYIRYSIDLNFIEKMIVRFIAVGGDYRIVLFIYKKLRFAYHSWICRKRK